jgi:hypothetical protein
MPNPPKIPPGEGRNLKTNPEFLFLDDGPDGRLLIRKDPKGFL